MAVTRLAMCAVAVLLLTATLRAQSVAIDGTHSAGATTEEIGAAGTQLRISGEAVRNLRFLVEGTWGWRSDDEGDFFGTAYPYGGKVDLMEAYAEYLRDTGWLRGLKGGRYRTPFGIYSASDHAYLGFLRAPLIRYGEYFALSNTYLEQGGAVMIGKPRLMVETSVSHPADVGEAIRRSGVTAVVRAQAVVGSWILGASYIDTMPYQPERFARGRAQFGGADVRWMSGGVLLRGEWLGGRPFEGTRTTGGYVDLLVHKPPMGPLTAFGRAERLAYATAPPRDLYTHRYTVGTRVRLWRTLAASIGAVYQAGELTQRDRAALDVGITGSWRRGL